jgi:AcrR family transcriptional regulator
VQPVRLNFPKDRAFMSPRPYKLGQRQASTDETRAKVIGAARELLAGEKGFAGFTIDAVARQAGVARMTVYYQFESKKGLLEALLDDLATRGLVGTLTAAFQHPDPREALGELVAAFGRFWGSDRLVIRRLQALGSLDPEIGETLRARGDRRRKRLRTILQRLEPGKFPLIQDGLDEAVEVLYTLTSFETFDTLAGPTRSPEQVIPLVQRIVRAALGRDEPSPG